jgi:hypothetical protein
MTSNTPAHIQTPITLNTFTHTHNLTPERVTFKDILPITLDILNTHRTSLGALGNTLVINRDLTGRVRYIVEEACHADEPDTAAGRLISHIAYETSARLGKHAYPADRMVLTEPDLGPILDSAPHRHVQTIGNVNVMVVDRTAMDADWSAFTPTIHPHRIVWYSMKGGVGRSTALAVAAWKLAEDGKRVMVVDLDLESPGLSSSLLPQAKRPAFGVADWLVEDLVDNSPSLLPDMVAMSDLSRNGEILVVPAHGADTEAYIDLLGRAWMPKTQPGTGEREPWSSRLARMLDDLESRYQPDIVLLDSRAGIDEIACTCITSLGAGLVLLFAVEGDQTWTGYSMVFSHWNKTGAAKEIRKRLQIVAAMTPDTDDRKTYLERLAEHSWTLFNEKLYDEIPPIAISTPSEEPDEQNEPPSFSYALEDPDGPHRPWEIRWHRSFAAVQSMYTKLDQLDKKDVDAFYGDLMQHLEDYLQQ